MYQIIYNERGASHQSDADTLEEATQMIVRLHERADSFVAAHILPKNLTLVQAREPRDE